MKFINKYNIFILFICLFTIFLVKNFQIKAAPNVCGNGVCQISQNETCITCPQDCGACSTPTPTPTPVPTTTPTIQPTTPPTSTPVNTTTPQPTASNPSQTTNPESTPAPNNNSTSTDSNTVPSLSMTSATDYSNSSNLNLYGATSVANGTISKVEYSLNNGATWFIANPLDGSFNGTSEPFFIQSQSVTDGTYSIIVRSQSSSGQSTSISFSTTVITKPPEISITTDLTKATSDLTPTITGTVKGGPLSSTQISFDGGITWYEVTVVNSKFSFSLKRQLEDGNYKIIIRSKDKSGNTTSFNAGELIIDTIPPIIGGNLVKIGIQNLDSSENGIIKTSTGIKNTIVISTKGGVNKALAKIGNSTFELSKIPLTDLWQGEITFDTPGLMTVDIYTEDGAKNTKTKSLKTFEVTKNGRVFDAKNGKTITDGKVSIYYFDKINKKWQLWQ